MLPFGRLYGLERWLDDDKSEGLYNPEASRSLMQMNGGRSKSERKSTEACKSHREAERRRRQRINAHLTTLRSLLPNAGIKSDKASLLAEVVSHVKRLRKQADEVAHGDSSCSTTTGGEQSSVDSEPWPFPAESDEATLSCCDGGDEGEPKLMKVTLCCEDRPGLNRDLTQAIRSVRAKAVRAKMMTIGGRTKSVVVIQWPGDAKKGDEEVGALERALKAVIENRALMGSGMGRVMVGHKRARGSYGLPEEVDRALLLGTAANN